ncbi:hypothetical protein Q8A67_015018 [Cirrhinus molitorella]|uniref:Uncharacterized protein n=1 Tax=Cirrhinus molitorella TaxID=172907 RepID=A0AA88PL71_9TELE|nr:hypothetical protein Q8A67_015018 [Cirrhinus molitorella]
MQHFCSPRISSVTPDRLRAAICPFISSKLARGFTEGSMGQPPRGESHLSCQLVWKDPLSHPKNPRLKCNRPPPFRHSPHRFPISHPTHPPRPYSRQPPGLLDPSPPERCPETWVTDGDSWWTSQDPSYEGIGQPSPRVSQNWGSS